MKKCAVLLLLAIAPLTLAAKLPADFKTCSLHENSNECLKIAIPDALKKLGNGLPELGAPPLDPLTIPSITIARTVEQKYTNMKFYNLTNGKLEHINTVTTPEQLVIDIVWFNPEIRIESDYTFKGRSLLISYDGEGKSVIVFSNIKTKWHLIAEAFKKNGKSYYRVKEFTFTLDPEKVVFDFENLIKGNKQLSEETNKTLNDNWKQVLEDIKPNYQEAIGAVFEAYINNIFSRIEIEELFPN